MATNALSLLGQPRQPSSQSIQSQIDTHDATARFAIGSLKDLPRITVKGRRHQFVAARWMPDPQPKRKSSSTQSGIWHFGEKLLEVIQNPDGVRKTGDEWWFCRPCDEKRQHTLYQTKSGKNITTSSALNHLEGSDNNGHRFGKLKDFIRGADRDNVSPAELGRRKRRRTDHHDLVTHSQHSVPFPHFAQGNSDTPTLAAANLARKAITELVACCDLPISLLEAPQFRQLLHVWNPTFTDQILPKSDTTMMKWLVEAFTENLNALKRQLHSTALSKIHLSADLWTSPNSKALVAVVAHFVDLDYNVRNRLIGLRVVNGRHTGENLQYHLHQVISDYGLQGLLGWLTFDNDETNDKATRLLFRKLLNLGDDAADKVRIERRCRCWGHIINLIVKSFLAGDGRKVLNAENIEDPVERERCEAELKDWRKRSSPLYHAHKIVVFIKGSQARLESFKALTTNPEFAPAAVDRNEAIAFFDKAQAEPTAMDFAMAPPPRPTDPTEPQTGDISGLSVKMANDTRWNSDAAELDRLLKLRKAVDYYTQKRADAGEDIQPLSVQEWRVIESVRDLLQPFLYHTKLHEGNSAAIHDVFSSIWDLEQHLRVWLQRFGGKKTHAEEEILDEITASSTEVIPTAVAASPSSSSQSSSRPRSRQRQQQEEAEESDTSTSRGTSWRQKQREAEYGFEGALFLQVSVQEALYLVAKYKRRLRSCPIYLAATILHPRYRTGGIRKAAPLLLDEAEQ